MNGAKPYSISKWTVVEAYDLVLARLTPAISNQTTFEKMMKLSKGWCFYAKATQRTDTVLEAAKLMVGIENHPHCDSSLSTYSDLLCKAGKNPFIVRYHDLWPTPHTLEQSMWFYGQILRDENLSDMQRADMMKAVEKIVKAGAPEPRIEVEVMMLGWQA